MSWLDLYWLNLSWLDLSWLHLSWLDLAFHSISLYTLQNLLYNMQPTSRQVPDTCQTPVRHLPDTFQTPTRHFPDTFIHNRNTQDELKTATYDNRRVYSKCQVISRVGGRWVGGWLQVHNYATSWSNLQVCKISGRAEIPKLGRVWQFPIFV